jgi:hypothetical protein
MRLRLISCEVFYREMCAAVARSPHTVDMEFLPQGLHNEGKEVMLARLQAAVDASAARRYDAIILGYGLCSYGLAGLTARAIPLVVPRAHDCIAIFLGSCQRYLDHFHNAPGTYFLTSGWIERAHNGGPTSELSIQHNFWSLNYEQLVEKYGDDNAAYLMDVLSSQTKNYNRFTYIAMGVEPDDRFERQTAEEARRRSWKFEKIMGDMSMIRRLVDGQWDEKEFLTVQPGFHVVHRYDDGVIGAEPAAT